jgi:hypothetical protein
MTILPANSLKAKIRIIFCIVLVEFLIIIFSGVSLSSLHGNPFFNIGVDPFYWLFFLLKIPQFIVAHQWIGIIIDSLLLLGLILFIKAPGNNKLALFLFLLMLCFYITLTGYLTHRNYQFGFVLVFFPFAFRNVTSKMLAYEALRYFLLFFYFSSALFKITGGNFFDENILSTFLKGQFAPYYLEGNTGWRTDLNGYLVDHSSVSYFLFVVGVLIELSAVLGFFTKKFDTKIAVLLILFHSANWILMDIAPIGQVGFISLLFLSTHFNEKQVAF